MPRSAVRCVLRGTNTQAVPLGWVAAVGACRCLSVPAVCCGALLTTLLLPPALLPCAACRSGCAGCVGPAKCLCGCEMDGGTIHECAVWGTRPSHGCCSGSRGQRNAVDASGMDGRGDEGMGRSGPTAGHPRPITQQKLENTPTRHLLALCICRSSTSNSSQSGLATNHTNHRAASRGKFLGF